MANFNLTTQQIKDTYEQLVQVSGSALVNGTGSLVNAFDYPSNSTYNVFSSSVAVTLNTIVAGSGSADWNLITNKPAGLVSGSSQVIYSQITGVPSGILSSSSQIATNISGAFTSTSASLAAGIATNKSDITTKLDTSTFTSYSSSVSTRLTTDEINISTNTSNIATQTSRVDSLVSATSSYAVKNSNNTFTGTQTFANIAVSGTASIAYLEQVTGSAVIIGEEFIILNTSVPAARYAGIKVYDTGSNLSTASFIFDGVTNDWFYQYSGSDETDFGVVLFGPEYGTIGNPLYPTANQIQKGTGGHHLTGSNISDDGSQVSITGPVSASTYFGNGSNLTGISNGLVLGHGVNSLQSALTTTPALANAAKSIAIGNNATTNSTGSISIGNNAQIGILANGAIAIGDTAIGENCNASVVIGAGASVAGNRSNVVAIGSGSKTGGFGVAIGNNANGTLNVGNDGENIAIGNNATANGRYAIAIGNGATTSDIYGINIGDVFKFNGSTLATIDTKLKVGNSFFGGGSNAVTNTNSFSYGSSNTIGADNSVILGAENNTNNASYCAILGAAASTISSGDTSVILGGYQNTINGGLRGIIIGGNQVINGQDFSVVLGKVGFTATKPNTTYVDNFESSGSLIHTGSVQVVGSITSSVGFSGNGSGLTNVTALSASYAQTASFAAGNFEVAGQLYSPVFSGSIASSTSSIDFNEGNFAVLTLTSATHIGNPSNIKSGTTYTLIINSGSLAATYGTSFKFAGGTKPTLSNGVDIVTMVSDGSRLFATGLANFS